MSAEHKKIQKALYFFASDSCLKHGLHLSVQKLTVWWPKPPTEETKSAYPPEISQSHSAGTILLQSPIGSEEVVRSHVMSNVDGLLPLMDAITNLEDAHVAFTLLCNCANACKLVYIMRTVPPSLMKEAAVDFDRTWNRAFAGSSVVFLVRT